MKHPPTPDYDSDLKRALHDYVRAQDTAADLGLVDRCLAAVEWSTYADRDFLDGDGPHTVRGHGANREMVATVDVHWPRERANEVDLVAEFFGCEVTGGRVIRVVGVASDEGAGFLRADADSPFEVWDRQWRRTHAPKEVAQ